MCIKKESRVNSEFTLTLFIRKPVNIGNDWLSDGSHQSHRVCVPELVCKFGLCPNRGLRWNPKPTGVQYTLPQSKHSAPPHAPSFSLQRSWFLRVTEDRRAGRLLFLINGGTWCPLHVPLATTSKLHPNDTLPILITGRRSHGRPLIPNQYQI